MKHLKTHMPCHLNHTSQKHCQRLFNFLAIDCHHDPVVILQDFLVCSFLTQFHVFLWFWLFNLNASYSKTIHARQTCYTLFESYNSKVFNAVHYSFIAWLILEIKLKTFVSFFLVSDSTWLLELPIQLPYSLASKTARK